VHPESRDIFWTLKIETFLGPEIATSDASEGTILPLQPAIFGKKNFVLRTVKITTKPFQIGGWSRVR
jgi:hypothetical protein